MLQYIDSISFILKGVFMEITSTGNELLDLAIPLVLQGKSLEEVSKDLSLDKNSLFSLFRDHMEYYLKARVSQGYTMEMLVNDCGVSRTTLLHNLQKYNLKLARKVRPKKYESDEDRKRAVVESVSNWRRKLKESKALLQIFIPHSVKEELDSVIGGETLEKFFIKIFNFYKESSKNE